MGIRKVSRQACKWQGYHSCMYYEAYEDHSYWYNWVIEKNHIRICHKILQSMIAPSELLEMTKEFVSKWEKEHGTNWFKYMKRNI